ncbi:MAG: DUF3105 domain-containing protein [Actinomycetota bacterium]
MADNRETKRERREVAKQRRMEELRRRQRKERMRKFWYAGISVLVIGGIVAAVVLSKANAGKQEKDLNKLAAAAGCSPLQNPGDEGNTHVAAPNTVNYRTNPPTSGNHYASTSRTGVLPNPLPANLKDENLVHNMEHGHIILWYKPDLDTQILDRLKTFVNDNVTRRVLVVRAEMPYQLAFTAWGHLLGCETPNSQVLAVAAKFADNYQGKGPEGTGDAPGTPIGS